MGTRVVLQTLPRLSHLHGDCTVLSPVDAVGSHRTLSDDAHLEHAQNNTVVLMRFSIPVNSYGHVETVINLTTISFFYWLG